MMMMLKNYKTYSPMIMMIYWHTDIQHKIKNNNKQIIKLENGFSSAMLVVSRSNFVIKSTYENLMIKE
jgi:hypothetical protein